MIVVGYLDGHVLRILRRQFQLDRRRVQHLHVREVHRQVARRFRLDLVIAQRDVAKSDRATRVSEKETRGVLFFFFFFFSTTT